MYVDESDVELGFDLSEPQSEPVLAVITRRLLPNEKGRIEKPMSKLAKLK